jgi:bifunctional DNase/RNase
MLETEIWSIIGSDNGSVVLLRPLGSDTVTPIFIGHNEAHAILLGLGAEKVKRPLTCDTLLELSRRLGLGLFRVEVHEVRDDVFYARLLFSGGEYSDTRPLIVECRPSDAIALAVRAKCAIYVAPRVLDQAGVPADLFSKVPAAGVPPKTSGQGDSPATERRLLQAELERAVGQEDYERAAELRDALILLNQRLEQEQRGPT